MQTFSVWLTEEIDKRGWSEAEFARRGKITPQSVNQVINDINKPGMKMFQAAARAFEMPLAEVMRIAGEMPPRPSTPVESWRERLEELSPETRQDVIETVERILRLAEWR